MSRTVGAGQGAKIIDLSALARRLLLPEPSAAVEDATEQVLGADLLLVASPTFKGTYTGLLKVFLDRLPYRGLAGITALPLLVMNSAQHALAVEVHLRPFWWNSALPCRLPGSRCLNPISTGWTQYSDRGRLGWPACSARCQLRPAPLPCPRS